MTSNVLMHCYHGEILLYHEYSLTMTFIRNHPEWIAGKFPTFPSQFPDCGAMGFSNSNSIWRSTRKEEDASVSLLHILWYPRVLARSAIGRVTHQNRPWSHALMMNLALVIVGGLAQTSLGSLCEAGRNTAGPTSSRHFTWHGMIR